MSYTPDKPRKVVFGSSSADDCDAGARLDQARKGAGPLYAASVAGRVEVVSALLNTGVDLGTEVKSRCRSTIYEGALL
jgi:hypothetical protein